MWKVDVCWCYLQSYYDRNHSLSGGRKDSIKGPVLSKQKKNAAMELIRMELLYCSFSAPSAQVHTPIEMAFLGTTPQTHVLLLSNQANSSILHCQPGKVRRNINCFSLIRILFCSTELQYYVQDKTQMRSTIPKVL